MFGYIRVYKPELKMKEFEMYRGIYCSLCKQLGKSYGVLSRLILNYDLTFLSMLLMAADEEESNFKKSHCTFCHAKKCVCCTVPDKTLEFIAAITVLMAYYKVIDDTVDGNFFKKSASRIMLPYFKLKYKKAKKLFPDISEMIKTQMLNQREIEKCGTTSTDKAAHHSAQALGKIIASAFSGEQKENAYRFGYCLGRFVYLCDALDDLEKDYKDKSFNVFLNKSDNNFSEIRGSSFELLDITADELAKAYELIKLHRYKSILDNIIYYGLDCAINKVLRKEEECNEQPL